MTKKAAQSARPKKAALSKTKGKKVAKSCKTSKVKKTRLVRGRQPFKTMRAINYQKKNNPFPAGMFFLLLILLTTVVLSYKVYEAKDQVRVFQKKPAPESTPVAQQERDKNPAAISHQEQAIVPQQVPNVLLLDYSNGQVKKREGKTGNETGLYTIKENNVIDALFNARSNKLVYAVTDGSQDRVKIVDLNSQQVRELVSEDHSQDPNADGAEKNTLIRTIEEISPNGVYATYSTTGWEWCNDKIIKIADKNELLSDYCQSTRWSKDGSRILVYNHNGMATSTGLSLTSRGSLSSPVRVDFAKLTGDVDKLKFEQADGQKTLAEDIMAADFISASQVVFLTTPNYSDQGTDYKLFTYDEAKKSIKLVATFRADAETYHQLRYIPQLNSVIIAESESLGKKDEKSLLGINLNSGEIKTLLEGQGKYSDVRLSEVSGTMVVIKFIDQEFDQAKKTVRQRKTYLVDAQDGGQLLLSDKKELGFVGFAR